MTPLYSKIETDLVSKIQNGYFAPDAAIPTELELCTLYRVSRITIRRAIERLVASRILYRRRGIGTFINQPNTSAKTLALTGYLQEVLTFDKQLSAKILKRGLDFPPPSVRAAFRTKSDEKLYFILATNFLDGEPYAVTKSFFPEALTDVAPRILMRGGKTSIQYIEKLTNIRVSSGQQTIEPSSAEGEVAGQLGLRPGTPILAATRLFFADGPLPVEIVKVDYHPDRYQILVNLLAADRYGN